MELKLQKGFTLIELLIVVAILGVLAAVAIPQYQGYQRLAKIKATETNFQTVVNFMKNTFSYCSSGDATTLAFGAVACNAISDTAVVAELVAAQGMLNPYTKAAGIIANTPAAANGDVGLVFSSGNGVALGNSGTATVSAYWDGAPTTSIVVTME